MTIPSTPSKCRPSSVLGLLVGLVFALSISHQRIGQVKYASSYGRPNQRLLLEENDPPKRPLKILYTITSLAEYNTGTRATVKGSDRLQETMIPVLSESVHSMLAEGYLVDVFIVAHYKVKPERLQLIRDALPPGVGLKYWDDAMPLGYDTGVYQENDGKSKIGERALSLARQHRFVIKEHFLEYDIFANWEDDMLIKGEQVNHYLAVTNALAMLKEEAPEDLPGKDGRYYGSSFHGPMTKGQLNRMIPGFIRVEVLLQPNSNFHTKDPLIPVDLVFDGSPEKRQIDPGPCCHVAEERSSPKRPSNPQPDQLMFWETEILPLGVRKMPENATRQSMLDWVALLRGPTYNKDTVANSIIGDYWAGADGHFEGKRRPSGNARNMINNMGGWMATREQIWEWHTNICPGGFLPPYEAPHFRFDGLDLRDVEWWSGGLHLVTARHACNLQRIMVLDPDKFHLHLLYHTANNKQSSLPAHRFTRANDLLGQLNTVRKNAEIAIANGK